MQLYVLDDNGRVVFTLKNGNYQLDARNAERLKVIDIVLKALRFLLKNF